MKTVKDKVVIIIIFLILGVYLFFFINKFENDTKSALLTIEETRCISNLSQFVDHGQLKFNRYKVQKDIDLKPSENLYTWDVSFSGKKYKKVGFIPEVSLYEKMIYAVFGKEFRGCGIHILGYEDIKPPGEIKKFLCPDGRAIYFSNGVYDLYYFTYYRIEKNGTLVTHFTLAKDMKDLESSVEMMREGKCTPE